MFCAGIRLIYAQPRKQHTSALRLCGEYICHYSRLHTVYNLDKKSWAEIANIIIALMRTSWYVVDMAMQQKKGDNPLKFHKTQLQRHCRVCATPFERNEYLYFCSKYPGTPKIFGIDVNQDRAAVRPPSFCNMCYAKAERAKKGWVNCAQVVYEWTQHPHIRARSMYHLQIIHKSEISRAAEAITEKLW